METTDRNIPTIGILGTGQLAAMMARDYKALGGRVLVYGENRDVPAADIADELIVGEDDNLEQLVEFFKSVDIVTLENEFLSREQLQKASEQSGISVYPEPDKYGLIESKLQEKNYFDSLGIKVAPYVEIKSLEDIPDQPGFLKLSKGGYDGKGTYKVANRAEATPIFESIQHVGEVLFEHQIDYDRELSIIAAASDDELVFYPVVETQQEHGTCRYVLYPAGISRELEAQAREMVGRIMKKLGTRGLFAFELFLTKDQQLILNESAPRPHNSGHITIDSHNVSQFENHMRAVANLPLIEPSPIKKSAMMINLLANKEGEFEADKVQGELAGENINVDLYGKKQSRPNRKMGHINIWGENLQQRAQQIVQKLETLI